MSKKFSKPFILIDGSSYLYRAFHALPPLTNSKGQPTGAIYGVVNMIRKLLAEYDPARVVVVFDAKGPTFRHEMYKEYKAHRPPMPPELRSQIEPLHALIKALGLPLLAVSGVEADDVIATLAKAGKEHGLEVLISTGDKDMTQLVNGQVNLINTMSNAYFGREQVIEKYGVAPEQIVDYLSLIGDKSDNIPGIDKVGPKTAAAWLQKYGSLDEIIKHADEFKGKLGENLRGSLEQLQMAHSLVTLKYDVSLDIELDELVQTAGDREQLTELLQELEFKKWLSEAVSESPVVSALKQECDYQTILTQSDFVDWLEKLKQAEVFAFDTETNNLDALQAKLVGVSFAVTPGEAAYVPLAHDYEGVPAQLNINYVLEMLKPLLESKEVLKCGQNLKYDLEVLANYDIHLNGIAYDTMLESYVVNSAIVRHDMDSLALKYLGFNTVSFSDVAGSGKKQLTFNQVDLDKAGPYAAEDADVVLQLHEKIWPLLAEHEKLVEVFNDIEMPLINVLARMEMCGVKIDVELLQKQSAELAVRIAELEVEAYQIAGQEFNLASPKQLQEILYDKLQLPVLKKTPKKQPSTAEPVLQELALDYPLPKIILEHRSLSKLKSTYTDALPQQINPQTGRIHTSYNQAVTTTGRLSSTKPNLQNIPVRSEEGRRIRQAFVATADKKIISADYSQIELRIMAHLSQDPGLISAFANDGDIHRATAAEVLGIAPDEVTKEQRRRAKAINFGLIYGMSPFGLAKQLGISRKQAEEYIELYFQRYPGVQDYMHKTRSFAKQHGFVETIFGRRLYVPDVNSSNYMRQMAAERAAINAPMQGTAADIIKIAMINIDRWILGADLDITMLMQVHDELVFEVAEENVESAVDKIREFMTQAVQLSVPVVVDIGVGNNWDEAH
ncbi:MAG: DNA polymerase I [Gammaproteobacteria bacterium]|nr:DNA polymerase I [Gammaproteobacteria bacterium]